MYRLNFCISNIYCYSDLNGLVALQLLIEAITPIADYIMIQEFKNDEFINYEMVKDF